MIATILPSGSNFFAVEYNERKVQKGVARLLEIQNFPLAIMQHPTSTDLRNYLIAYSAKNDRITNTQFHAAISCKGHEHTEAELVDFAHQWLAEMGYADKGQPLLIYAHTDTDNTHIHIVTSRVNPLGRKIDHNHERRRSQAAVDKILGNDRRQEVADWIQDALQYRFSSVNQFQAILEAMGAEAYIKNDTMYVKRGGSVQGQIDVADIQGRLYRGQADSARIRQLQAIVLRYQASASDKKELQDALKKKFGISLVFFGRSDSPYGYMVVDNATRQVFNGAQIMKIKELLDFMPVKDRFKRIDMAIQQELMARPQATTADINRMLRRQFRTQIRKGTVTYGGSTVKLNKGVAARLRMNDRLAWAQGFSPTDSDECDVIAHFAGLSSSAGLQPSGPNPNIGLTVNIINGIFNPPGGNPPTPGGIYSGLRGAGIALVNHNGEFFAVDFSNKTIVNLAVHGIKVPQSLAAQKPTANKHSLGLGRLHGHGQKREWEIRQGIGERVDDERSLKM